MQQYADNVFDARDSGNVPSIKSFTATTECDPEKPLPANRDAAAAFKKIISLVNVRDRSVKQIKDRLLKDGYPTEAINDAVDRALSCRILDDSRYAETLVRSRINQGKGTAGVERELRGEGIDIESVSGWPYEFDVSYDGEFDRALGLLERKPTHAKNKMQASYRKLVQAGFPARIAGDASRAWCEKNGYR